MSARPNTAPQASLATLLIGAIGIVFGDIGTSPLYAIKETLGGHHPLPVDRDHVLGVLSLIFWSLAIIVTLKYVILVMRADNRGEGGSLALLALLGRAIDGRPRRAALVTVLGLFAAALFYGDSIITPAISVVSAVEGLNVAAPGLAYLVEPIAIVILAGLFLLQRSGSSVIGALFGPVMLVWFATLAGLGIANLAADPSVLAAVSPHHALMFFFDAGPEALFALGSVVLTVTGAEALYADMGHFGRRAIQLGWYLLVWPALLLNYFGQGALLLAQPEAVANPFFHMAPAWASLPLVVLATCATVIASQAVISGAFSLTRQAVQLGYLPRLMIRHTSERAEGQIYIPFVNWALMLAVVALVVGFETSSDLAAAYGIAVTGTMVLTTVLAAMVMRWVWGRSLRRILPLVALLLLVDVAYFVANLPKIPYGGWFPLAVAAVLYVVLTTWKSGREALRARMERDAVAAETVFESLGSVHRVGGTAVYLSSTRNGAPASLLHNLKHNQVLHERVVLLTVEIAQRPYVPQNERIESERLGDGLQRIVVHYGFMDDPLNIPRALANARESDLGFFYEPSRTTWFVSRVDVQPTGGSGMAPWREALFAWMVRNSAASTDFFRLPINRVVALGTAVEV